MPEEKDEKPHKQELTVASVRSRLQNNIRREQIQQFFNSIRGIVRNIHFKQQWPQQVYAPVHHPIMIHQLRPEYIQFLQYCLGKYPLPALPPNVVPAVAAEVGEVVRMDVSSNRRPIQHDIYFQKQNFRVYKKLIGEGSFSKVWQGVDLRTDQKIAAKQIKKAEDNQYKYLHSLHSQHIIKIHDIIKHQSSIFIILEYCENNLREELIACNYDLPKVLKYIEEILKGLNELQLKNFIHRDLKFQNILISKGVVKIADFGLAKHIGTSLEVESRRCGTPYTMAPEIFFSRDSLAPYTIKCDIWSLGIILHQMLYQKHPFNSCTEDFKKRRRIKVNKKFGLLDQLIEKCLVFDPDCRINWNEVVQIFKEYQKMKDRYLDANKFPINAESIVCQGQNLTPLPAKEVKVISMNNDLTERVEKCFMNKKQESNRHHEQYLKMINDFNAQEVKCNNVRTIKQQSRDAVAESLRAEKKKEEQMRGQHWLLQIKQAKRLQRQQIQRKRKLRWNRGVEQQDSNSVLQKQPEHFQQLRVMGKEREDNKFAKYRRKMQQSLFDVNRQEQGNSLKNTKQFTEIKQEKPIRVKMIFDDKKTDDRFQKIVRESAILILIFVVVVFSFWVM